jgi:hypothetical protein
MNERARSVRNVNAFYSSPNSGANCCYSTIDRSGTKLDLLSHARTRVYVLLLLTITHRKWEWCLFQVRLQPQCTHLSLNRLVKQTPPPSNSTKSCFRCFPVLPIKHLLTPRSQIHNISQHFSRLGIWSVLVHIVPKLSEKLSVSLSLFWRTVIRIIIPLRKRQSWAGRVRLNIRPRLLVMPIS